MITYALFTILSFFSSPAFADLTETKIGRLDGSVITFYLDQPTTKSKFPFILFLQGSECRPVIGRPGMPMNPSELIGSGFLMIEKYGITKDQNSENDSENCTPDFLQGNTLDQRALDALKVITHLRRTASNWDRRLFIVGGSEGGMLAPILAALIPETKKVAMLVAGNGRTMLEDTREALVFKAKEMGLDNSKIADLLKEFDDKISEIRSNPTFERMYLGHTYKWWNSVLWVNPIRWMLDLDFPQLLIHGSADSSVPVESARSAVRAFHEANNGNLTYWELPDCDHSLTDKSGVSHKMEYLQKAIQWLLSDSTRN